MDLADKVESAVNLVIKVSREFDGSLPWELGFSGGKDSTVTLSLLVEALRRGAGINKLYVVYSDTLLEHPVLRKQTLEVMESLKQFKNIEPVVLKPKEDFITMMVEKGYTAPDFRFRWCMKRLKIEPVKEFMKKLGRYVQVSGVRASESPERSRKYGESEKVLRTPNPIVMPILDWSTEDVFEFLKKYKRWDGKDFGYLLELYNVKEGNGCGCPISSDVRFGCWTCTVVKVNKMPVDPILENARKRLMEVSNDPKFRILDENGRPRRKLNDRGRKEVAKVFLEVAEKYPEALGYDIDELKEKLRKIIEK